MAMTYDKRLKPCPKCDARAFVSNDVVDGFWFGWSVGCPRYCLNDGIHGIEYDALERTHEKYGYTGFCYSSKERAIEAWNDRVEAGEWRISPWASDT